MLQRQELGSPKRHSSPVAPPARHHSKTPHRYFGWTEGNPIVYLLRFLLFGEGAQLPSPTRSRARRAGCQTKARNPVGGGNADPERVTTYSGSEK